VQIDFIIIQEAVMKKLRRAIVILLTLIFSFVLVPVALAHPLGNFTINHYAEVNVTKEAVVIDYIIDMAEIPAFQEIASFDANGNGQPDPMENNLYHAAKCQSLQSDVDLRLNDRSVGLTLTSSNVEFPSGAGGLRTLRLTCNFNATLLKETTNISFSVNAYAERLGWREIVVTGDGVRLPGDFASTSLSQRLTAVH
jgi:nickel/cobalt exporter